MNGEQLIARVLKTIQDPSVEEDEVLDLLNEGLVAVADAVLLPALETTGTVDTIVGEFEVALPDNFQRNLFACAEDGNSTGRMTVSNNKQQMLTTWGTMLQTAVLPKEVCASFDKLLYAPQTEVVKTLELSYYRAPTLITESDSPTCLPPGFHRILFHYASFNLFDDIEDGMEGPKKNTLTHEGKYDKMLEKLELRIREGQSRPEAPVVKSGY